MTLPTGPVQIQPDTITQYIRTMQAQVDEATRQTLYSAVVSAGGLTIRQGGAFVITNSAGNYNVLETKTRAFSDGTQYQPVVINRPPSGEPAFAIYPAGGSTSQPFFWTMFDRQGHFVLTDDAASGVGLSKPYLAINMYPRYPMPANPTGPTWLQIPNSLPQGTSNPYQQGKIPWVSHPYLQVSGVFGWASGGTGNITYTLTAGSASVSWSVGGATNMDSPLLDMRGLIGTANLDITLSWTAAASPAGQVSCHIYGAFLRGT